MKNDILTREEFVAHMDRVSCAEDPGSFAEEALYDHDRALRAELAVWKQEAERNADRIEILEQDGTPEQRERIEKLKAENARLRSEARESHHFTIEAIMHASYMARKRVHASYDQHATPEQTRTLERYCLVHKARAASLEGDLQHAVDALARILYHDERATGIREGINRVCSFIRTDIGGAYATALIEMIKGANLEEKS